MTKVLFIFLFFFITNTEGQTICMPYRKFTFDIIQLFVLI